jgi:hypothetical protein
MGASILTMVRHAGVFVAIKRATPTAVGAFPGECQNCTRETAHDYPFIVALMAILLSVAVLVGIAFRYAGMRADPTKAMTSLRA